MPPSNLRYYRSLPSSPNTPISSAYSSSLSTAESSLTSLFTPSSFRSPSNSSLTRFIKLPIRARRLLRFLCLSLLLLIIFVLLAKKVFKPIDEGILPVDTGRVQRTNIPLSSKIPVEALDVSVHFLMADQKSHDMEEKLQDLYSASMVLNTAQDLSSYQLNSFQKNLRDTYSIYLSYIKNSIAEGVSNPILPFSWSDWYDFSLLKLKSLDFLLSQEIELFDSGSNYTSDDMFSFDIEERGVLKAIRGMSFLSDSFQKVDKLIFLDSQSDLNHVVKVINVPSNKSAVHDPDFGLAQELKKRRIKTTSIDLIEELKHITKLREADKTILSLPTLETRSNKNYLSSDMTGLFINLQQRDFRFDIDERIEEIHNTVYEDTVPKYIHYLTSKHLLSLETIKMLNYSEVPKFYHEVALKNDPLFSGCHYDWRFFKRVLSDKEKYLTLHHLVRTWQEFANKENIIYWVAHGNLLSWKWSGGQFLWDYDCDLQMPIKHLEYLSINFNGSLIIEDPKYGFNRYYIDINPHYLERDHKRGYNIIDGRFIDIYTGLYIDLTALSFDGTENLVSDKNIHKYKFDSLTPLRATLYEGAKSWIPFDTDHMLLREYKEGFKKVSHREYKFVNELNAFLKKPEECLKVSSTEKGKSFEIINPNPKICDQFDSYQLEYLYHLWGLKKIENDMICLGNIKHNECYKFQVPNDLTLSRVSSQEYNASLTNFENWKLPNAFVAESLARAIDHFESLPVPGSDLSTYVQVSLLKL